MRAGRVKMEPRYDCPPQTGNYQASGFPAPPYGHPPYGQEVSAGGA